MAFHIFQNLKKIYSFLRVDKYGDVSSFNNLFSWSLHILLVIFLVESLGLNYSLFQSDGYDVDVINILLAALIVQISRSLDWICQHLLISSSEKSYSGNSDLIQIKEPSA